MPNGQETQANFWNSSPSRREIRAALEPLAEQIMRLSLALQFFAEKLGVSADDITAWAASKQQAIEYPPDATGAQSDAHDAAGMAGPIGV